MPKHMQLTHYSASYIRQAVLSAAYLGKSLAQASLGEAVRYPPHPINDKRASQPYADAAYCAIKALLAGVLDREWDKSMLPHRRQGPSPPGSGRRQPSRPCCLMRRAAPQGLVGRHRAVQLAIGNRQGKSRKAQKLARIIRNTCFGQVESWGARRPTRCAGNASCVGTAAALARYAQAPRKQLFSLKSDAEVCSARPQPLSYPPIWLGEGVPDALPIGGRLPRPEDGDNLHTPPPPRVCGGARVVFAVAGDGRLYILINEKNNL